MVEVSIEKTVWIDMIGGIIQKYNTIGVINVGKFSLKNSV